MNPKVDFCGMLKSSMKHRSFLPPGGANTPLVRFSSFPSMVSWSELLLVCAEKLTIMLLKASGRLESRLLATMLLPTPTRPTTIECRCTFT